MSARAALGKALLALAAVFLAAFPSSADEASPLALSGKAFAALSLWEARSTALAPAAPGDWAGRAGLELRAVAGERARLAFEGRAVLDLPARSLGFELAELWAEWRLPCGLSLKAGRQRVSPGPGLAWNPSDFLHAARYAAPGEAGAPVAQVGGVDAARVDFPAAGPAGFPLSLSALAALPASGESLEGAVLGLELYALAGLLELDLKAGASGPLDAPSSWSAGGWITFPAGSLVVAVEGAARLDKGILRPDAQGMPVQDGAVHGALSASGTLRSGDFIMIAEIGRDGAAYSRDELDAILASPGKAGFVGRLREAGSVGLWHGCARLVWASGDLGADLSALVDLEVGAWRANGRLEWAAGGDTTLRLDLSLPGESSLSERDELGLSSRGWSLVASVEASY